MQVRVLCEKAKEILMEESNVQVMLLHMLVGVLCSSFTHVMISTKILSNHSEDCKYCGDVFLLSSGDHVGWV
jgi:hypothetical protein